MFLEMNSLIIPTLKLNNSHDVQYDDVYTRRRAGSFPETSTIDDDDIVYVRPRSSSFKDSMKENNSTPARISSPKQLKKCHNIDSYNHHKESHHHHHHRRVHKVTSSPSLDRKSPTIPGKHTSSDVSDSSHRQRRCNSYTNTIIFQNGKKNSKALDDWCLKTTSYETETQRSKLRSKSDIFRQKNQIVPSLNGLPPSPFDHDIQSQNGCSNKTKTNLDAKSKEDAKPVIEIDKETSKQKTIEMIEKLLLQTKTNFEEIESHINLTFLRLSNALDNRRIELVDEARKMCDGKIESLNNSKERCSKSWQSVSRQSSISDSDGSIVQFISNRTPRRGSVDEHDDILQHNKILEPWRDSEDQILHDEPTPKSNPPDSGLPDDVTLEEGNLGFIFDEETIEMFNSIGTIEETLSSPQLSFTNGLSKCFAISGEEVHFEVHTVNKNDEPVFKDCDKIDVTAYDPEENKIDVLLNSDLNRKSKTAVNSQASVSFNNKCYIFHFTPKQHGDYKIEIILNGVGLSDSPYTFSVYPKMNLTFHVSKNTENKTDISTKKTPGLTEINNTVAPKRHSLFRRENSEDSDWTDSNWMVQKGDKYSLLLSSQDVPSYIYAVTPVTGLCAWKFRITSACTSITLSIGVGTRSGIPDIDEHYSCDFKISELPAVSSIYSPRKSPFSRRNSMLSRISLTYAVILNTIEKSVRIISTEWKMEKNVRIDSNFLETFRLYPFCSMIHHHINCVNQVCPRPQITLI